MVVVSSAAPDIFERVSDILEQGKILKNGKQKKL